MIPQRLAHLRPSGAPTIELTQYPNAAPIFIIGSVRSGTSAMMAALRDGAQIRGFNEGVLAHLLPGLLSAVHHHYSTHHEKPMTMLGSVPEEYLTIGIKNLFGKAFIETMGEGRWLDKTPGGAAVVAACPSLLEIFPNAKFIFCKRRGVENVLSRQVKFPGRDFEAHCQGWASTMDAWLETAPQLGDKAIAIDQRAMAIEPEQVSSRLAVFLDLSPEQREGVFNALRGRRLEQTRSAQDDVSISLEDTDWSDTERETFRRVCGPMMAAFEYDFGDDSSSSARPAYQFFVPVTDGVVQRENVTTRRACRAVDATRFKIDPNPAGEPAAGVRHRMIEMERFRQFSARLRSVGPGAHGGEGLIFRFSLERSDDHSPAFSAEQVVKSGPASEWVCDLPPLSGLYDAILSVRLASDVNPQSVSSLWINAQLA